MAVTDTSDTQDVPPTPPPVEPLFPITTRAWWHRHLEPEERRRVMDELAITRVEHWAWRFTIMLTLSVIVAVMGLSANSAAVVIGAMLLAPLMQPVLATAASLSMSLVRKSLASLFRVALATAWCIAIAYLISMLLPAGPLSNEIEARTQPDIRDLVVALAAGMAGAYATVRKDASSSLPGVAVAVALVPPLATIGITLEAGEPELARGASLLYFTNLAAIVFAGVMVFIATGFVPPRRLANTATQLLVAGVIALAVVVAVSLPLYQSSVEAVEAVENELRATAIVDEWLVGRDDLQREIDVGDNRVRVQLRGFDNPPGDDLLRPELQEAFGEDVTVIVEFVRIEGATTTTVLPPSEEQKLIADVEPVVDEWLAQSDDGNGYEREDLRVVDGRVVVDVTGSGEPPSVDELEAALTAAGLPSVGVSWTARQTITTTPEETPAELVTARLDPVIAEWADRYAVEITLFAFDGEQVMIEASGPDAPPINVLVEDVRDIVGELDGGPVPVEVLFTERRRLTTTIVPVDGFGGLPASPTTTTTTPRWSRPNVGRLSRPVPAEAEPGERFPHGTILVLGIITIAAYGAWFYAFGVLLDPILADTGWSETGLAATFSVSAALGALGAVPAGRFVDRYSSRPAFLLAAGAAMAGIWFASYAESLLAFAAGAILAGASLQGLSFYHVTQATSVRVAPGQPTRAIALLTIYGAFSSAIYLPLAAFLVTEVGWRQTMRMLVTITAVVLVVGAFVVRERRPSTRDRATPGFDHAFRLPAARRYVTASALTGFGVGVMLVYQVPLMTAAGLSVGTAAWMAGARGAAQITGRIPLTFIVDRIGARAAVQMSFAAITVAMVVLAFAGNVAVALLYVAIAGFGIGAASPLQGIYGTELFDEAHLGASMGVITMVFGLANAIGPTIVGLLADVSGSRWWGVALAAAGGLVAVATMSARSHPDPVEQPTR